MKSRLCILCVGSRVRSFMILYNNSKARKEVNFSHGLSLLVNTFKEFILGLLAISKGTEIS